MPEWRNTLFSARAQVVLGAVCVLVGCSAWAYGSTLHGAALLQLIFHISMFFGLVACYSIIATGLGFRATERVEETVIENLDVDLDINNSDACQHKEEE